MVDQGNHADIKAPNVVIAREGKVETETDDGSTCVNELGAGSDIYADLKR